MRSFRRIVALMGRIIRQFTRDRRTMALLFVAPLVIMTLLQVVLNASGGALTLALVPPEGATGAAIVSRLRDQLGASGKISVITIAADQVDQTLRDGNADGALIFPADFTPGQPATLTLRLEGTDPGVAASLTNLARLALSGAAGGGLTATAPAPQLTTSYLYGGPNYTQTDALAPIFVGLFAFFFVFLLASVAFLRERAQGTFERLVVSPMRRTEVVVGYVAGFTCFALVQSLVILLYVVGVLRVHERGNLGLIFLVTALLTIGGVNMGIFVSAFARNELQVIQFIPLLLVPQILLGGLFFPVKTLPVGFKQLAYVLPLTHANFALRDVMLKGWGLADIWPELAVLVAFATLMILLATLSLRGERV